MTRDTGDARDNVLVPDLVGLTVAEARRIGHDAGVVVTASDPDGVPLGQLTWPGVWTVTAQRQSRYQLLPAILRSFHPGRATAGQECLQSNDAATR